MIWWILGGLCTFLFVAAILFVAVAVIREARREKDVRARGEPILGWIVQANNILFEEGTRNSAAQILITFDPQLQRDRERMQALAEKLGRLKEEDPEDELEEELAELVTDETARFSKRYKLPEKFTGGPTVYSTAVMIKREYLPEGVLVLPYIHCVGLPGDDGGEVYMTDYPDVEDDRPRRRPRPS